MGKRKLIPQSKQNYVENNSGYYLELLSPEAIKLLGSTKSEITKDENGQNVSY